LGGQRFVASFTPHETGVHTVQITFNGETVPGKLIQSVIAYTCAPTCCLCLGVGGSGQQVTIASLTVYFFPFVRFSFFPTNKSPTSHGVDSAKEIRVLSFSLVFDSIGSLFDLAERCERIHEKKV
jgi:hypothetical protein